jgi:hypothetical protein
LAAACASRWPPSLEASSAPKVTPAAGEFLRSPFAVGNCERQRLRAGGLDRRADRRLAPAVFRLTSA